MKKLYEVTNTEGVAEVIKVKISNKTSDLYVDEFVSLLGEIYKDLTYQNDLSVVIHGLAGGDKLVSIKAGEDE